MRGVFLVADQNLEDVGLTEWVVSDLLSFCAAHEKHVIVVGDSRLLECAALTLGAIGGDRKAESTGIRTTYPIDLLQLDSLAANADTESQLEFDLPDGVESPKPWSRSAWREGLERCSGWIGVVLGNPRETVSTELLELHDGIPIYGIEGLSQHFEPPRSSSDLAVELDSLVAWRGIAAFLDAEPGEKHEPVSQAVPLGIEDARREAMMAAAAADSMITAMLMLIDMLHDDER